MSNYDLTRQEIKWLMENCGQDMPDMTPTNMSVGGENITITGEPDHEISMAVTDLEKTARYTQSMAARMQQMGEHNLPAWVQAKITKISDYASTVYHYMEKYLGEDTQMMSEGAEGKINTASHEVEIDVSISKSDMKKLHDGKTITLSDTTGTNSFKVSIKAD